jgi:hypothetical protein
MHAWLSIIAFAFSIGAGMAEDLPAPVQKAIAEAKRDCKTVAIEKGFITRKDINGDGRPDFVLDYESFICDGDRRAFCGSLGCTTQVFASLPNGASTKVIDGNFKRIDFRDVQGRPAIVVGFPGFSCGKDPTEVCDVVKSWNGSSFVEMPGPGTSPTAGTKNAKLLGPSNAAPQGEWTSAHVPQGAIITSSKGKEIFQIEFSCGSPQPIASVTIYGGDKYHGSVLKRVETDLPFILEVQRAFGGSAKFPVILYYSPADGGTWNTSQREGGWVTPTFFDAFAHDGRLIWRTGGGAEIASWSLKGSAEARESVRTECNF